ncbi:MAG: HAMP domain-containing histidine kinase, partial [Acidobacteria bacterium]|nr:HAMP domain-containing histidine kinase [Acidobacteriota bacterium]
AITSALAGDRVRITVTNSGKPIPEELLAKMFDPFFTTKPVGRGTGLGLGICKAVLRRCGGSIEPRNDPEGVTFEVTLPAAALVAAGQSEPVGAAARPSAG